MNCQFYLLFESFLPNELWETFFHPQTINKDHPNAEVISFIIALTYYVYILSLLARKTKQFIQLYKNY